MVDERLDPYSGRYFPKEARTEDLARRVRQERLVEGIVRARSWEEVRRRCEGVVGDGWEDALSQWEKGRPPGR